MKDPFVLFWAVMLFSSIGWYAFLVFYIGIRAGAEIKELIASLTKLKADADRETDGREPT